MRGMVMKINEGKTKIIEAAFKFAYGKGRDCPVKPEWERRVMSHIRYLDTTPFHVYAWNAPALWKAAAAVCMGALIVLAYSLTSNIGPEYDAASMFMDDPMGIIFNQPLFP